MAFDIRRFGELSGGSSRGTTYQIWSYNSDVDDLDTIWTPGYFGDVVGKLQLGDLIYITDSGSTDIKPFQVTAVTNAANVTIFPALGLLLSSFSTVSWTGGLATLVVADADVRVNSFIITNITTAPTESAYMVRATPGNEQITFELSAANTSNDCTFQYSTYRFY